MHTPHQCFLSVRWGDMDAYQHVNNTAFFRYLESARFRYFEEVCGSALSGVLPLAVLVDMHCHFVHELHYPAEIAVHTAVTRLGNSSFEMQSKIFSAEILCATAAATLVWLDPQTRRPQRIPEKVRAAIAQFEGF